MSIQPTSAFASKAQPELDEQAKNLLLWLYGRAREAEKFTGTKQAYGAPDPQGYEQNDWSGRLRNLVAMEYGDDTANEIFEAVVMAKFEESTDEFDVESAVAEEPEMHAMSLQPRAGDNRPTLVTAMSLCRSSNPEHRKAGKYAKANPHTMQLPTMADAAMMSQSNNPKLKRLGFALLRNPQFTEDGRPRTAEEQAADDKLVNSVLNRV